MTDSIPIQCSCGKSRLQVRKVPQLRFFCHCGICQMLYKKAYADVTVLSQEDVVLPRDHGIHFKKYRSIVGIDRGTCPECSQPVIALAGKGAKGLAFVAAANYSGESTLPSPKIHIFYDRCVSEIADDLPKYRGYLRSQFAVMRLLKSAAADLAK